MGKWFLDNIIANSVPFNNDRAFGHDFRVTFTLRYQPSLLGNFTECPVLDWYEQIKMKEHHTNQYWEFEKNMYEHNPSSNTLKVWPTKYIEAHNSVFLGLNFLTNGRVSIRSLRSVPLTRADLGNKDAENNKDKSDVIRNYLKKNGGILVIEVHDVPSILKPDPYVADGTYKERLLLFNCGLVGGTERVRAMQYLSVNCTGPVPILVEEFSIHLLPRVDLNTTGFVIVDTPDQVSRTRKPMLFDGEYF